MKRYVRSNEYVKATSEYYDMVHMKIEDLFKQYKESAEEIFGDDEEVSHDQIADFIASHMVELLDEDEWKELAFDWLQMNYS